jgi:hypothetical protein
MLDSPATNTLQDETPANSLALNSMTRRELITTGGKLVVGAAVSSAFSPFTINVKAAPVKTLSFWQFYAPAGRRVSGSKIASKVGTRPTM